jgi:hypothetical protein
LHIGDYACGVDRVAGWSCTHRRNRDHGVGINIKRWEVLAVLDRDACENWIMTMVSSQQ